MAERSTAAVDVAGTGGEHKPPAAAQAAPDTADGTSDTVSTSGTEAEVPVSTAGQHGHAPEPPHRPAPPPLHSGHKIAKRYRLEECVTRLDGFSSWRAVDEMLRRAVGVHLLPSGHPRAAHVLAAARSAALLGDPRFVQVLDAVEDGDIVYVVHEWLPDAVSLRELLAAGPLPAHEAYELVSELSQAMTAAHRAGLAHLHLTPGAVLRTGSGQYRVLGLAVSAALRGVGDDEPQRADTEAIGALLYAALTQRWPYPQDAHGLSAAASLGSAGLPAPEQVRAGVHRGLSELAMCALVNDGATASSQQQPCVTPQELARALSALPRIRPPEPLFHPAQPYQSTTYQSGSYAAGGAQAVLSEPGPHGAGPGLGVPAALPGRTGAALKWGVSALLLVALGLGSWQVSDILMNGGTGSETRSPSSAMDPLAPPRTPEPIGVVDAHDFDPLGDGSENPESAAAAFDDDPESAWLTSGYYDRPDLGGLKPGVGLVLDLGKVQQVSEFEVAFGDRTSAQLLVAPEDVSGMPASSDGFRKLTASTGERMEYALDRPVRTRYVLVWLTSLPRDGAGDYRGRITDVRISG